MRDLANSGAFGRRSFGKKKLYIILGAILVLGVVLSFVGSGSGSGNNVGGAIVLSEAPPNMAPVPLDNLDITSDEGVNLTTETASMEDVRYGGQAKATVTRSHGADVYKLDVNATLPDPVNVEYGFWLVGDDGPILIDYLRGSGTKWSLSVGAASRYANYDGVIISLERSKDDVVEEKIMEGSF